MYVSCNTKFLWNEANYFVSNIFLDRKRKLKKRKRTNNPVVFFRPLLIIETDCDPDLDLIKALYLQDKFVAMQLLCTSI